IALAAAGLRPAAEAGEPAAERDDEEQGHDQGHPGVRVIVLHRLGAGGPADPADQDRCAALDVHAGEVTDVLEKVTVEDDPFGKVSPNGHSGGKVLENADVRIMLALVSGDPRLVPAAVGTEVRLEDMDSPRVALQVDGHPAVMRGPLPQVGEKDVPTT